MPLNELNQKTVRACDETQAHLNRLMSFIIRKRQHARKNKIKGWDELGDVNRIKTALEEIAKINF